MIIPTILTSSFEEFKKEIKRIENNFSIAQIDVMDGVFVQGKSFEERSEINELNSPLKFDLHLMVSDPAAEIKKWQGVKNISQIFFHFEACLNPEKCISKIHGNQWKAGMAINPETPLTDVSAYYNLIDTILFMTVHPGKRGALFLPEVEKKIAEYQKAGLRKPKCAVDGGINENNIGKLAKLGVEVFYVGSALTLAKDMKNAYKKLADALK